MRPRHAASLILWRAASDGAPEILMGRRHRDMRFMPGVLVFPGGRVDRADHGAPSLSPLSREARDGLEVSSSPGLAHALGCAAARELHEEAGLTLGEWRDGALHADLGCMAYLCRAITPPRRPIRFHARFLIAPAERAHGTIQGSGELEEVRFFSTGEIAGQTLAPITQLILREFLEWHGMTPAERAARPLIRYQGWDNRVRERRRS
ncbi:MAG: NUDIX hydrolase [Acetobacteraceae bacterium]|nr:NUDIX hydrolase [Acetobacteraceae bacterium]